MATVGSNPHDMEVYLYKNYLNINGVFKVFPNLWANWNLELRNLVLCAAGISCT